MYEKLSNCTEDVFYSRYLGHKETLNSVLQNYNNKLESDIFDKIINYGGNPDKLSFKYKTFAIFA